MTTTSIAIDIVRDVMKIMEKKDVCYLDIPQSLIDSVENFLSLAVYTDASRESVVFEEGKEEGYDDGYDEGYRKGYDNGYDDGVDCMEWDDTPQR